MNFYPQLYFFTSGLWWNERFKVTVWHFQSHFLTCHSDKGTSDIETLFVAGLFKIMAWTSIALRDNTNNPFVPGMWQEGAKQSSLPMPMVAILFPQMTESFLS